MQPLYKREEKWLFLNGLYKCCHSTGWPVIGTILDISWPMSMIHFLLISHMWNSHVVTDSLPFSFLNLLLTFSNLVEVESLMAVKRFHWERGGSWFSFIPCGLGWSDLYLAVHPGQPSGWTGGPEGPGTIMTSFYSSSSFSPVLSVGSHSLRSQLGQAITILTLCLRHYCPFSGTAWQDKVSDFSSCSYSLVTNISVHSVWASWFLLSFRFFKNIKTATEWKPH